MTTKVSAQTFIGRRIISENGMNGRLLQVRRRRLGIKSSDLAALLWLKVDAINRVENCLPYIPTRETIVHLDEVLARFETQDIETLIKDYMHAEAYNSPFADYEYEHGEEIAKSMRQEIEAHHRILTQLKTIKEPPMGTQLYTVTFENGDVQHEYGTDEEDVRIFIARSFHFKGPVKSVALFQPE